MVVKHLFKTVFKLLQSSWYACGDNVFNYLMVLIIILNIRNTVAHAQMISFLRSLDEPNQLQSASLMAV